MPSSKFPVEEIPVPEALIALSGARPDTVFCNLRPDQRPEPTGPDEQAYARRTQFSDGLVMYYSVARFLRGIAGLTRVAIIYQGYGPEVSTLVCDLPPIECWAQGIPRLDYVKPDGWNHCPNFWGTFILAIAQVTHAATAVMDDPDGARFIEIVTAHGLAADLPETIVPKPGEPSDW